MAFLQDCPRVWRIRNVCSCVVKRIFQKKSCVTYRGGTSRLQQVCVEVSLESDLGTEILASVFGVRTFCLNRQVLLHSNGAYIFSKGVEF